MMTARIAVRLAALGAVVALATAFNGGREILFGDGSQMAAQHVATFQLNDYTRQMRMLRSLGLDIAGVDFHAKKVDLVVDERQLDLARTMLGSREESLQSLSKMAGPDAGYHDAEEVAAELQALAEQHSAIARVESIGKTLEDRSIWAIKISDNPDERELDEPRVLFNAMHHAREVMTTEVAMDTAEQLLSQYGEHDEITHWVDSNEIWIVPMVNPDGNDRVWHSNMMWRKNARDGFGVDLNRNYPYRWNGCNGSSGSQWAQDYRGESPASEPETNALMGLVARTQPVINISYHSYSEMVLYPYGCRPDHSVNRAVIEGIGAEIAGLLPSDDGRNRKYAHGTPWELLYSADGGDIDWMYNAHGVIPYVIELNSRRLGFHPSFNSWRQATVEKLRAGWGYVLNRLEGPGIRGQVLGDLKATTTVSVLVKSVGGTETLEDRHAVKADGTYHIVLAPGSYELSFEATGSEPVIRSVELGDERQTMDVQL